MQRTLLPHIPPPTDGDPMFLRSNGESTYRSTSVSLAERYAKSEEFQRMQGAILRGEMADAEKFLADFIRGVTSTMTAFPVRENLDAEVHVLSTVDTPLSNMIPVVPGEGTSAQWRVQSSFGAGLGTLTTTSGTTNAANTWVVANARGFFVGESIYYNGTLYGPITAINYSTNVITVASGLGANTQTAGLQITKANYFWTEQGAATRMFYPETGAAVESTTAYLNKTAAFKLMGTMGSVTLFAVSTGRNFQDQYNTELQNTLIRAMLQREYALLWSYDNVTAAPWGDGTTALGFQGLVPFMEANMPAANWQTAVGAVTALHLDQQLTKVWYGGGRDMWLMLSGREAESLTKIVVNTGNFRLVMADQKGLSLGGRVATIIHSVSGAEVPIYTHQFIPPGTILYGANRNSKGQSTMEMQALDLALPGTTDESKREVPMSGFYAQEITPDASAHDSLKFVVKSFCVPKWKNAQVFAESTGVLPAA